MAYSSLRDCIEDLERHGELRRVDEEVDPHLEMAEIQRRVYAAQGPALLFTRVKGTSFPCVANLYGTKKRTHFLFRHTLADIKAVLELKRDPLAWMRQPWKHWKLPRTAWHALPQRVNQVPVMACETKLNGLPQIVGWPKDGGAFITLPQVYSEHPAFPGLRHSNLGMYRIQLSGGHYRPQEQVGLHYQIHRGIGVHHHASIGRGEKLKVSIFVGGPPAHALAAVMPLPEGFPEIFFAGMLAGRRFQYQRKHGHLLSADADFCLVGTIDPGKTLPEGPFGDHLGYYSLTHPFPVMEVEKVYHRRDAIWPFTVVGRPPQEDSQFAELIHELAGPILPLEIPGLHAVHAVESAGVHPLLLAIGSERYVPYGERKPRELLTLANAILGYGQLSLAKFLWVTAKEDKPELDIRNVKDFFIHVLERVDWREDLHFQTRTTQDTLDYSGPGLNTGSKVVIAAAGKKRRQLITSIPAHFAQILPEGFLGVEMVMPGIVAVTAPAYQDAAAGNFDLARFLKVYEGVSSNPDSEEASFLIGLAMIVLVDDARFTAQSLDNFLWVSFTRSDPARDIHGLWAFTQDKHWGCRGPLVLDARIKPHHAPILEPDPVVTKRVDEMAGRGRGLWGLW